MGYNTDFNGCFITTPPVPETLENFINAFANIRHVKRNIEKIRELDPDWQEHCFNGDIGKEGSFYIPSQNKRDETITDYNSPPEDAPGLWCQWVMTDNQTLEWDGNEKFYAYTEWLEYLISNFFQPSGILLNGSVKWSGDAMDDIGTILCHNNKVETVYGEFVEFPDTPENEAEPDSENFEETLLIKMKDDAKMPARGSEYAAGYDLCACLEENTVTIQPHKTVLIPTGICARIPAGCFGGIFARSGLASKKGLRPANCVGVIDEDYTGEIMVALHNDTEEERSIENGERIAQLIIIPYKVPKIRVVDELPKTDRGSGGFGSTGTK